MKKVFSFATFAKSLFCLLGLCLFLSSCGNKNKSVISVYKCAFNNELQDETQLEKLQKNINKQLKNLKAPYEIKLTVIEAHDYSEKTKLALENNDVDIFWTTSFDLEKNFASRKTYNLTPNKLCKNNEVLDLTLLLNALDESSAIKKLVPQWAWTGSAFQGKNYFIPSSKTFTKDCEIAINKSSVSKENQIKKITTLKDLEPLLQEAVNKGKGTPFVSQESALFSKFYITDFDFICDASFIAVDRDTNALVNTVQSPEYAEFCKLMGTWKNKDFISSYNASDGDSWAVSWWNENPFCSSEQYFSQPVELFSLTNKYSCSDTALYSCYGINAKADAQTAKLCLDFIEKVYSQSELAELFYFDFEKTVENSENSENENMDFEISCARGFCFDVQKVALEYEKCLEVFNEYGFLLENGGISPKDVADTITTYQALLDRAGYQKVLTEAQKQYKAWK
ncbi:MAG: DUF3502 domain-containing protein [Treponema sp.]|nr:DUF3502 domain-containing protein [Treponema sp.]